MTKSNILVLICGMLVIPFIIVSPVHAGASLDLVVDEGVAVPWEINNISPGSSGQVIVNLRNAGSIYGFLAVWIDNIVDSEGENPESETGNTEEPGELSQYVTLNISGLNISPYTVSPDFQLPVALNDFPQSSSQPLQLSDQPLQAGGTIQLTWEWAVPLQAENDIQGDSVSFTIYYTLTQILLVQKPSTTTPITAEPERGYWLGDVPFDDAPDDETSDIMEYAAVDDAETDEQPMPAKRPEDTSGNTTGFHSQETDAGDDVAEVILYPTDDDLKPALPETEDSRVKIDLKNIGSTGGTPMEEIFSRISLIVAVSGTLAMIILAYIERKRRAHRRMEKG